MAAVLQVQSERGEDRRKKETVHISNCGNGNLLTPGGTAKVEQYIRKRCTRGASPAKEQISSAEIRNLGYKRGSTSGTPAKV